MARSMFGGGAADWLATIGPGGTVRAVPGTLTVWSAASGGAQYTDLLVGGDPATSIHVGSDGQVPAFQGPDGVTVVWADGGGSKRVRLTADPVTLVEQAVEDHTPGIELGYAERTTTYTTTTAATVPGLSVTVTGQGRPVDIEAAVSRAYHSVNGTAVEMSIAMNTSIVIGSGTISSFNTATGPNIDIRRRLVLDEGVDYTFTIGAGHNQAGTITLWATAGRPLWLSVVSR